MPMPRTSKLVVDGVAVSFPAPSGPFRALLRGPFCQHHRPVRLRQPPFSTLLPV